MSDEKRWLEDGAPEAVRELLVAARAEEPDPRSVERALVAIGVSSAVLTAGGHAAGAALRGAAASMTKGASAATSLGFALKWGAVGAALAVTTFGVGHVAVSALSPDPAPRTAPSARALAVAPREAPAPLAPPAREPSPRADDGVSAEPERTAAEPVAPPEAPAAPVAAPSGPVATPPSVTAAESLRMAEEVAAIDRARSRLSGGDPRGALAALDAYAAAFPERRFEPEALYLRMEAESRLGDAPAARAAAERLLAAFPHAPQAERARLLVTGSR